MLIPFALFVGLLVATAVIAHVSDNLGKKLGKKRVSVLGLRPRHTATLLTIGSSWGIMIFTLFMLLIVVAPLRKALFSYESERERLLGQVKDAKSELTAAQFSVVGLRKRTDLLQKKSDDLQKDVQKSQETARKSQQQAREYQGQAEEFKDQAQDAQRNLQSARRGEQNARRGARAALLTAKNAQASAREAIATAQNAQTEQIAAQKALTGTQNKLKEVQAQLSFNQSRLQVAQGLLGQANARLADAKRQTVNIGRQAIVVGKQFLKAQKDLVKAEGEVEQRRAEVARYQGQIKTLQLQFEDLKTRAVTIVNDLDKYSAQFEFGNIRLPVNQPLAERRLDATRPPREIARELRIIVDAARTATRKIFGNLKLDFVVGATVADGSGGFIELNEDETVEFYANVLSSARQTVSGRLVSVSNYPNNTPQVVARFIFIPIRTIYLARQDIAAATIDTNKSESAIFRQLQDLVDLARRNAEDTGARPPLVPDPEAPNFFFDGDTGPKMFAALRAVQKFDKSVRVRIVAARDLDSAEPLQIRFVVGDET